MRQTRRRELAARRPGPTRLEVLPIDVAPAVLQCRALSGAAASLLTEPAARALGGEHFWRAVSRAQIPDGDLMCRHRKRLYVGSNQRALVRQRKLWDSGGVGKPRGEGSRRAAVPCEARVRDRSLPNPRASHRAGVAAVVRDEPVAGLEPRPRRTVRAYADPRATVIVRLAPPGEPPECVGGAFG